MLFIVSPLVHLLIAVFNNLVISGAITKCTHGLTHITSPLKFPKISTLTKRESLVLIFWRISTGDVIYSIATGTWYNARVSKSPCEYKNRAVTFYFEEIERARDQKELPYSER